MCTGRIDMAFVLRAFSQGADGVLIVGCRLNECNYATQGNFYALSMTSLCKGLLEETGINPGRLRIELMSGGEGNKFAEVVNSFSQTVRELGCLGTSEQASADDLKSKLQDLTKLIPYIKIAKREKLAVRLTSEEEYRNLFTGGEIRSLLAEAPSYYIDPEKCQACRICAKKCPVAAIEGGKNLVHVVDQGKCIRCGCCFESCPPLFGAVTKISGKPVPPPIPEEKRTIIKKKDKRKLILSALEGAADRTTKSSAE